MDAMAALTASSKTSFSPFFVSEEHSKYLTAFISLALAAPCSKVIGARPFSLNLSMVSLSSLKSDFVPTRMIGVLGQQLLISG